MLQESVTTVPVPLTMKANIRGYMKDKYINYFLKEEEKVLQGRIYNKLLNAALVSSQGEG